MPMNFELCTWRRLLTFFVAVIMVTTLSCSAVALGGENDQGENNDPGDQGAVPEIDPATTSSALILLFGGILIMTSRRRLAPTRSCS